MIAQICVQIFVVSGLVPPHTVSIALMLALAFLTLALRLPLISPSLILPYHPSPALDP